MALGKDWDRESADLFIHDTGARISKSLYRGKVAWWFFPASLDSPAVEHPATDAGRDEAFATSVRELPKTKTRRKPKAGPDKKAAKAKASQDEKDPDANPEEEEEEDKDENGE